MVNPGLPADRRIDHREERCRHHDERKPAIVGRGREAREVADHTAPDRDDGRFAIGGEIVEGIVEPRKLHLRL